MFIEKHSFLEKEYRQSQYLNIFGEKLIFLKKNKLKKLLRWLKLIKDIF